MFQDPVKSFPVGRKIPYGPISVSKDEIIEFAEEFDPVFFHTDEEAAKYSLLGGLSASGFHTCGLTMRMICDSFLNHSTCQGSPEIEQVNWSLAVRPGDTLKGTSTVNSARFSESRPDLYLVNFTHETHNQDDNPVMTMSNTIFFKTEKPKTNA